MAATRRVDNFGCDLGDFSPSLHVSRFDDNYPEWPVMNKLEYWMEAIRHARDAVKDWWRKLTNRNGERE